MKTPKKQPDKQTTSIIKAETFLIHSKIVKTEMLIAKTVKLPKQRVTATPILVEYAS